MAIPTVHEFTIATINDVVQIINRFRAAAFTAYTYILITVSAVITSCLPGETLLQMFSTVGTSPPL